MECKQKLTTRKATNEECTRTTHEWLVTWSSESRFWWWEVSGAFQRAA